MGWFLIGTNSAKSSGKGKGRGQAKGKTQSRSKAKGKAPVDAASPRPWDPQRTMLGVKALLGLAAVILIALGWGPFKQTLSDYASDHGAREIGPEQVMLENTPGWMSPLVQQQIRSSVSQWISPDPVPRSDRPNPLAIAAEALRDNPWVANVRQVQRMPEGTVRVDASYRQPVAMVRARDGFHLVDRRGVRLPVLYYPEQRDQVDLPVITGVSQAPPRAGQPWRGADLEAGLALSSYLTGEPYETQIRAIDVSRRDAQGRLRLSLNTREGAVIWGLPIGQGGAVEEVASTKRQRLRQLHQRRGSIDVGGQIVNIYGPGIRLDQTGRENQARGIRNAAIRRD